MNELCTCTLACQTTRGLEAEGSERVCRLNPDNYEVVDVAEAGIDGTVPETEEALPEDAPYPDPAWATEEEVTARRDREYSGGGRTF